MSEKEANGTIGRDVRKERGTGWTIKEKCRCLLTRKGGSVTIEKGRRGRRWD